MLGGKLHRVRFGLLALKYLEDKYGALDKYIERMTPRGWAEGKIHAIVDGMVAGTLHEKPSDISADEWYASIEAKLDENVDGLVGWIQTLALAINEAYPATSSQAGAAPKGAGSPSVSRGPISTSSRRSRSGARTRSSGR